MALVLPRKNDQAKSRNEEKLQEFYEREPEKYSDPSLASAVVLAMLRFRNLAGSQFDSAADAKNQKHDIDEKKHHPPSKIYS